MITIIYRKTDLRCVGSVMDNMTIEQEIEFNVIPNFGGNIEDYSFIETDMEKFHLEQENGEIVIVKDKIDSIPNPESQPSQQDLLNSKLLKDNAEMKIELDKQKELNATLLMQIAQLGGK